MSAQPRIDQAEITSENTDVVPVRFTNRDDAGRQLAAALAAVSEQDSVILGIPRGGLVVAAAVARELELPLDALVVRERSALDVEIGRIQAGLPTRDLQGRIALIVDDGIATGATARLAARLARLRGARKVVIAAPVGPVGAARLIPEADAVICLSTPKPFVAVGRSYSDFAATPESAVLEILLKAGSDPDADRSTGSPRPRTSRESDIDLNVTVPVPKAVIEGRLRLPGGSSRIVVFAHGSGSSRHSPRNVWVAQVLFEAGIGSLLLDLLTSDEEHDRSNVFDIDLLAARLAAATRWLQASTQTMHCRIGYFGASTGAGAAIKAAADEDLHIGALVSRGGRPDLAGAAALAALRAPTLLIVGGADEDVLTLNSQAKSQMRGISELTVVPRATHLFVEPGALVEVAVLARAWFLRYLGPNNPGQSN
jgi:putative phosphoribosyl transferase